MEGSQIRSYENWGEFYCQRSKSQRKSVTVVKPSSSLQIPQAEASSERWADPTPQGRDLPQGSRYCTCRGQGQGKASRGQGKQSGRTLPGEVRESDEATAEAGRIKTRARHHRIRAYPKQEPQPCPKTPPMASRSQHWGGRAAS